MLDAVFAAINRHTLHYRGAIYTYSLVMENGQPHLLRAELRFSASGIEPRSPRDYPGLMLREEWLGLEEAKKLVEAIASAPDSLPYKVKGPMNWSQAWRQGVPVPSHDRLLGLDAAAFVYTYSPNTHTVQAPVTPLIHLEHPVFSDSRQAVDDWVGARQNSYLQNGVGLMIVIPDPRAAISNIRLTNEELQVTVAPMALGLDSLLVRTNLAYGEDRPDQERVHPLLERRGSTFATPLSRGIPKSLDIFLLDTRDSSIVDWQQLHALVSTKDGFLTVEVPSKKLIDMISNGESDELELKEQVGDKIITAIAAFANGTGGLAVIGVDDDRQIVGVDDPGREGSRLVDMVNSLADPVPLFDVSYQTLHGENVIVVRVPPGDNPPYTVRGRAVYVRRKDRNVPASRHDLDAMYAKKNSGGHFGLR